MAHNTLVGDDEIYWLEASQLAPDVGGTVADLAEAISMLPPVVSVMKISY